jgi:Flp pilus assembly protein TadD
MQSRNRGQAHWRVGCRACLLGAALILSACATSAALRPGQTEVRYEDGFRIAEQVEVSEEVRVDFERAVLLLQQGRYDDGIALLLKVTEEAPDVTSAHIDLGVAYGRINDLERAEASIKKALELNPRHPVAHNELGILYRKTGRFGQARKSYERALNFQPDFHFARRNLAILCDVYLADLRCALENYERYVKAVPQDGAAAIWIADLHNRMGE